MTQPFLTSRPSKPVVFADLPEDMQVLIDDYFVYGGAGDVPLPAVFESVEIPLACFPDVELADGLTDERGVRHALDMVGEEVPPVIVVAADWLDGRHRAWAARAEGKTHLHAIDLAAYLPVRADKQYPNFLATLLNYSPK